MATISNKTPPHKPNQINIFLDFHPTILYKSITKLISCF